MSTTWSHVLKFYDSRWTDTSHFCYCAIFLAQLIIFNFITIIRKLDAIVWPILNKYREKSVTYYRTLLCVMYCSDSFVCNL